MAKLPRGTLCKPRIRPGRLFVFLTSGVLAIAAAMAPPTVRVALAQDARPIEEVVTIGTRGTTERSVTETAVPVDIISSEEIMQSGITETARLLQMLAPSFNFSTSTISDGTDIVRPATLRGLGPDQTLVLVNGKRRHNSALMHVNGSIGRGTAGVDLNAIPPSAISRIEIMRDGASAQYGSDAIAGVINIILKDQTDSWDFLAYTGETFEGDGSQVQVGINGGFAIGGDGFVNLTLEYRDREASNRAGPDMRQQYNFLEQIQNNADLQRSVPTMDDGMGGTVLDPTGNDGDPYCDPGPPLNMDPGAGLFAFTTCTNDPLESSFNRNNHRYGDPDSENLYFWLNSAIPMGDDDSEFYFFGGIAQREGESGGFYRRAEDARAVLSINPNGFLPLITTNVDDLSFSAGFRTMMGEWQSDTSLTVGENTFEFIIKNSNNVTLGPASPTTANAGELTFGQITANWDLIRSMDWGWHDTVDVSFGLEYRNDHYEINAGDFTSWANGANDDDNVTTVPAPCVQLGMPNPNNEAWCHQFGGTAAPGIQVFPGFRPSNEVDERRDAIGIYGEIETMLTDKFLFDVALRAEDYSDFGSTINGKLAGRYDINPAFGLRGSLSSGFRAPSLHQQWFNNTSTQFVTVAGVPNTPVEVGTFNNQSAVVQSGFQAADLEEETSINLGLGFTWLPNDQWNVSADLYRIAIDDRIVISGRFSAEGTDAMGNACVIGTPPGMPGFCPIAELLAPFPGVSAAQFFSNAIDTETTGLDIVAQWQKVLDSGTRLKATGSLNITETERDGPVQVPPGLAMIPGASDVLFSRQEEIWLEEAQPQEHVNLAFEYGRSKFTGLIRANYFGEVTSTESSSDPTTDQTFGSATLVDLDLGWDFGNGLDLHVGGTNIFDEIPDENIPANNFGGIFPFNRRTTPFGFNGGFYYIRATYSLER